MTKIVARLISYVAWAFRVEVPPNARLSRAAD